MIFPKYNLSVFHHCVFIYTCETSTDAYGIEWKENCRCNNGLFDLTNHGKCVTLTTNVFSVLAANLEPEIKFMLLNRKSDTKLKEEESDWTKWKDFKTPKDPFFGLKFILKEMNAELSQMFQLIGANDIFEAMEVKKVQKNDFYTEFNRGNSSANISTSSKVFQNGYIKYLQNCSFQQESKKSLI